MTFIMEAWIGEDDSSLMMFLSEIFSYLISKKVSNGTMGYKALTNDYAAEPRC